MYWSNIPSAGKGLNPSMKVYPNQIKWEAHNLDQYRYESKNLQGYFADWIRKNGICFESQYPDTGQSDVEIYKSVISDLNQLLGLNVRWVNTKERVFIIKRKPTVPIIRSQKNDNLYTIYQWVDLLNKQPSNPYIFDESGNSDLGISSKISSLKGVQGIKKALNGSGYELVEEQRNVQRLIFTALK